MEFLELLRDGRGGLREAEMRDEGDGGGQDEMAREAKHLCSGQRILGTQDCSAAGGRARATRPGLPTI